MREGLTAAAALDVTSSPGARQRVSWKQAWPVVLRPTGEGSVHLVHGAGGPLGGDRLSLTVDVGPGAALAVRSAGATLVQPGVVSGDPARWDVTARVGPAGRLDWAPQPTVVTDGAAIDATVRVELAADATALVRELVVLGRYGRRGGRYRGGLDVTVAGEPLFSHVTVLDGADPALSGPAGTAGARAVASLLVVGRPGGAGAAEQPGVRWAWSELDGPGSVLLAVGEPGPVTALLDDFTAALATHDRDGMRVIAV
jgi:urease accessory protein